MNAGMHDAINLGWKLSLVLKGMANNDLLETYDLERRPNAEKLIQYDEDISVLVSGRLPKSWKGDSKEDPHVALGTVLQEAKGFNTGLTLSYKENLAVLKQQSNGANGHTEEKATTIPAPAVPGYRAPDIKLQTPAMWHDIWLHQLTPNKAKFYVVVFAGDIEQTRQHFIKLTTVARETAGLRIDGASQNGTNGTQVNGNTTKQTPLPAVYLTITKGKVANPWFELGTDPLGKVYYDGDGSAHERYGVGNSDGGVFILRPDGWIGARFDLSSSNLADSIAQYLAGILNV